jgi:hypothetical protein
METGYLLTVKPKGRERVGAKGAESGDKDRQIRRPFQPRLLDPPHYFHAQV